MRQIFKFFMLENENTLMYIVWFIEQFQDTDFNGLDKLLYLFLRYCGRLGIVAKRRYLESFMRTEGKSSIYQYNIKLDTMGPLDYSDPSALDEGWRLITAAVFTFIDEVSQTEVDPDSFKVEMNTWLSVKQRELLQKAMTTSFPRLSSGDKTEEVIEDMQFELSSIQDRFSVECLDRLDFLRPTTSVSQTAADESHFIANFGIPAYDGISDGIYEGDIITYTGLTGSGKTRICVRILYNVAVLGGVDVRFDSLEMTKSQIENMLIAIHIVTLFRGEVKIPDSLMNKGKLTPEMMPYYNAAKEDLFNSSKYGKFYIYDDILYADSFSKNAMSWLRYHKSVRYWAIDYAGMSQASPAFRGYVDRASRIDMLYENCRLVTKTAPIAFFVTNQYNQSGAEAAKLGKEINQGDIQGGQSVHRYSTFNVYSTMTPEQKVVGRQCHTCDKSRMGGHFSMVPFQTDLSICRFGQLEKEITN